MSRLSLYRISAFFYIHNRYSRHVLLFISLLDMITIFTSWSFILDSPLYVMKYLFYSFHTYRANSYHFSAALIEIISKILARSAGHRITRAGFKWGSGVPACLR